MLVCLVAFVAADVEQEMKNERGDIDYRVSFKTQDLDVKGEISKAQQAQREGFTSSGKYTIEVIGESGSTGKHELIDHPSQVKTESGDWKVQPGMTQISKFSAPDVGEIKEVKIEGDNDDKWTPQWLKINSNDFHSGQGNGIYYASIKHRGIKLGEACSIKGLGHKDADQNLLLHKCFASFCKKAEHRYLKEGEDMDEEGNPEHEDFQHNFDNSAELVAKHGARYGPAGEGMPGTEDDHSMLHGHFMREFFMMGDLDEDDEDFLRTHTL